MFSRFSNIADKTHIAAIGIIARMSQLLDRCLAMGVARIKAIDVPKQRASNRKSERTSTATDKLSIREQAIRVAPINSMAEIETKSAFRTGSKKITKGQIK